MKVPDWQQRETPARDEELMNTQPNLEQHPGTWTASVSGAQRARKDLQLTIAHASVLGDLNYYILKGLT